MNRPHLVLVAAAAAAALALGGCKKAAPAKPKGIGRPLVSAPARNLAVSPDGSTLIFVADVKPPPEKDVPEGVFQGVLTTVPLAGGAARPLGGGVSTLDDGFRVSPDGKSVAYLQGFRFRDQSGSLNLAPLPTGDATQIADGARYYKYSPDARWLGYVAGGEMHLYDLAARTDRLVARNAATFEFSKDSRRVLVRRPIASGGELLLASVEGGEPSKLGENVGEYEFSPDGSRWAFTARAGGPKEPYSLFSGAPGGKMEKLGEGVSTFVFSPDGKWIAYVDGQGIQKNLGNLMLAAADGGAPKKVAENVVEYRWAPGSQALAVRESNEDKGRKWTALKVVALPGTVVHTETWSPHEKIDRIPFVWSPDGQHLAFMKSVLKPEFSVNLFQVPAKGGESREIAKWVFGFQYSPDGRELWLRTNCVRNGRECELIAASVDDAAAQPRRLVQGIWSFKASAKGERLLLTYPRLDTENAADLGWLDLHAQQPSRGVDQYVLPGWQFVDPEGTKVVYIVGERKREGVYVADLPK